MAKANSNDPCQAEPSELARTDEYWMQQALTLAREAALQGEVPVGAVVVRGDKIIGQGWNRPIGSHDPTAHAEIMALRDAAERAGNYRLPDSCLYVTLEPCTMCVGAIVHARVRRVVFGAYDPKSGAAGSVLDLTEASAFNHKVRYQGGVLSEVCGDLLKAFFQTRRRVQDAP